MSDAWANTTHDWQASVDRDHLLLIAGQPSAFAPGGARHLLHEVLAYVADEVEAADDSSARCDVDILADGSVTVRDYGRGTDTRRDSKGGIVRKPVMATKDLRFFDEPATPILPDGHARRGMSVVCALSEWVLHENHRLDGAWAQRYERGVPIGDLTELAADGVTGTLVHFMPRRDLTQLVERDLGAVTADWPRLHFPPNSR